jgi:hypothetical protein
MNERRRSSRHLRGRLYFDRNGRKSRPCQILDAFYEGARIIVDNPARRMRSISISRRKSGSRMPACDGVMVAD